MSSLFVLLQDTEYEIHEDGRVGVASGCEQVSAPEVRRVGPTTWHVIHDSRSSVVQVEPVADGVFRVASGRHTGEARVRTRKDRLLERYGVSATAAKTDANVKAPMPGLVLRVSVAEGDTVERGQGLIVLEAMKMENELQAPVAGTVRALHASVGDAVAKNSLLVEIEGTT